MNPETDRFIEPSEQPPATDDVSRKITVLDAASHVDFRKWLDDKANETRAKFSTAELQEVDKLDERLAAFIEARIKLDAIANARTDRASDALNKHDAEQFRKGWEACEKRLGFIA